ncbi:hypothetical protein AB0I60_11005 [Actinosynnema sp. NPDC050436]|uniref:hypothetical protein n=1 Tax=Actinosynnema sp. NPDC050436 TaxID=3155659 RepID=UPI0034050334
MSTLEGFHLIGGVAADERSRIAFGKAGIRKDDRYAVSINDEGAILLTPLASIRKRELLVWENDELRASLSRGLADAAEGRARKLDWVTADVESDEEDE